MSARVLSVAVAVAFATRLPAQTLLLQIKPHVGDTLVMRLDQQSELTGVRKTASGEGSAMALQTMRMFSRAIVEGWGDKGTTLLAVTDSVVFSTSDERQRAAAEQAQTQLKGQRVRFHVRPDGTVAMTGEDGVPREVAQVVSLMPAPFPKTPIKVGESWTRDMAVPGGTQLGAQISGKLHVTFRFDSLTHGGEWAFVSMRGEMQPANPTAIAGALFEKGFVNGTMLVDQRRGWLTESWFSIVLNSTQTPSPVTGVVSLQIQTRITQHMRTLERR
jgi:hypothetical protein